MKTATLAVVLVIVFAGGSSSVRAVAAPRTLTLSYLISVAGIETGRLALNIERRGSEYRLSSEIETLGLTDALIEFRSAAITHGSVSNTKVLPRQHRADNLWRGDTRFVRISYGPDGPLDITVEPRPEDDDRDAVARALTEGTIDALSAAYIASLRAPTCQDTIKVFDGRRRYNIQTRPVGDVESQGPSYQGPAYLCELELHRIAGHSKSPWLPPSDEETGRIWFAPLSGDWPLIPVRFEIDILLGSAAVHLRSATARGLNIKPRASRQSTEPQSEPVRTDK